MLVLSRFTPAEQLILRSRGDAFVEPGLGDGDSGRDGLVERVEHIDECGAAAAEVARAQEERRGHA